MRSRSALSRSRDGKSALIAIVLVLVLIISAVGVFMFFSGEDRIVKKGDSVKVNYIGKLPDGRVFDTSIYSVAVDNATYPKSLFFTYRGNESTYKTLDFVAGVGAMIDGFDKGVLGMKKGQTKEIVVPVGDGYISDPTKISTIQLNETVSVQQTISINNFTSYYGSEPVGFTEYKDPVYGWKAYVLFVDGNNVILQNIIPNEGAVYKAYCPTSDSSNGWNITVSLDGSGNISVHHQLDGSSALKVKGLDYDGTDLFVESVDVANGTAVLNRNIEVAGKELKFIVTMISIE